MPLSIKFIHEISNTHHSCRLRSQAIAVGKNVRADVGSLLRLMVSDRLKPFEVLQEGAILYKVARAIVLTEDRVVHRLRSPDIDKLR